jgi:uncharacterized membrane protein HdeD (DUF308 family)
MTTPTPHPLDTFPEHEHLPEFHVPAFLFIATAVAFIVLGTVAIAVPFAAGLAVTTLVGWLLIGGGLMHAITAFRSDSITRAVWQVLLGMFYVAAGLYFLAHPLIALGTLTISLACVLMVEAAMDLVAWTATRKEKGSGWLLVNTLATFALAMLIWLHWPSVSVWAIGTLVGVKLMVSGFSRLFRGAAGEAIGDVL